MAIEKTINIKVNSSDAEKKLKGLDKQVKTTSKTATQTGKGLSGAFSGMGAAISGTIPMLGKLKAALISTGIGALVVGVGALVGMFTSALNKGAEFEKGLSTLKAVSGGTEAELGKLAGQAKELGSTTQFTAVEVVKLQTELAKLGFTASDIGNSTPAILSLASSLEVDLASAAELAGSTVRAFGLTTDDTAKVVDVMALSTSSSALNFEALRESIKIVAPAARATGVSIEKTAALLGVLANNGLKGSVAGTGLSKSFIELNKQGITLEEGMAKVAGSSNKLNTAIELVGVVGAKSFLSLAESGKEIAELETTFNNASGAADRMAAIRLDNLDGDLTKLSSAWEGLLLSIENGNGLLATFARGVIQTSTSIVGLFTSTNKVSDAMQEQHTELMINTNQMHNYQRQIEDTTLSQEDRTIAERKQLEIFNKLKNVYPDILGNLNLEKDGFIKVAESINQANKQLIQKIVLQKQAERIQEVADLAGEKALNLEDLKIKKAVELAKLQKENNIDAATSAADTIKQLAENQGIAGFGGREYLAISEQITKEQQRLSVYTEKMNKLQEQSKNTADEFGISLTENVKKIKDISTTVGNTSTPDPTDEEKENAKKREAALKKSQKELANIIKKTNKSAEDLEDESEIEKAKRKRERALKELEAVKLNETKKAEAKIAINQYYDSIEAEAKIKDDEAEVERNNRIIAEAKRVSDEKIKIEIAEKEAKASIQLATIGVAEKGIALGKQLAGKNKAIQKSLLIAENAAGIAKILVNTGVANAKAVAVSPVTLGQPWVTINSLSAGLGIASSIAATAKGLSALGGGSVGGKPNISSGGSGGGVGAAPAPPSFNVVGASGSSQLADAIGGQSQQPIQTYVVSNDVTTAQSLQNNIVEGATIG